MSTREVGTSRRQSSVAKLLVALSAGVVLQVVARCGGGTSGATAFPRAAAAFTFAFFVPGYFLDELAFGGGYSGSLKFCRVVVFGVAYTMAATNFASYVAGGATPGTTLLVTDAPLLVALAFLLFRDSRGANSGGGGTASAAVDGESDRNWHSRERRWREKHWRERLARCTGRFFARVSEERNLVLLVVFVAAWSAFDLLRFDLLYGDDPWYHLRLVDQFAGRGRLNYGEYYGYVGFHGFATWVAVASGVDPFWVAYYYPAFSLLVGSVVAYAAGRGFGWGKDVAVLGTLALLVLPLGFFLTQGQFWPTSLAVIVGIAAVRVLVALLERQVPAGPAVILLATALFAVKLVHDVASLYYFVVVAATACFFRREVSDHRLTLLVLATLGVYSIVAALLPSSLFHDVVSKFVRIPWPAWVVGGVATIVTGRWFVRKLSGYLGLRGGGRDSNEPNEPNGAGPPFTRAYGLSRGKRAALFFAVSFLPVVVVLLIPLLTNFLLPPTVFLLPGVVATTYALTFTVLGFHLTRKRGVREGTLASWVLVSATLFVALLLSDFLVLHFAWWVRVMVLSAPCLLFAAQGYFHLRVTRGRFPEDRWRGALLVAYLAGSTLAGLLYESNLVESKTFAEDSAAAWLAARLPDNVTLLTDFHWRYVLDYHSGMRFDARQYHSAYLLDPDNHVTKDGKDALFDLLVVNNSRALYVLLTEDHVAHGVFSINGELLARLTPEDFLYYLESPSFNRVFSGVGDLQVYAYHRLFE